MANTKGRVDVPVNIEELLKLALDVNTKHIADGAASKLNTLEDYKWDVIGPKIPICLEKHLLAEKLKGQMETAYRERDLLLPDIKGAVNSSRDLLKSAFSKNPKKIAEWGYSVDDSPKPKKGSESISSGEIQ